MTLVDPRSRLILYSENCQNLFNDIPVLQAWKSLIAKYPREMSVQGMATR